LSAAFPKSKIVSRGNQILIKGTTAEIIQIDDVLNALIDHYHKFGRVTEENVQSYIDREHEMMVPDGQQGGEDVIV
jgi:phosphate starvation-inducible PhoH-like protein